MQISLQPQESEEGFLSVLQVRQGRLKEMKEVGSDHTAHSSRARAGNHSGAVGSQWLSTGVTFPLHPSGQLTSIEGRHDWKTGSYWHPVSGETKDTTMHKTTPRTRNPWPQMSTVLKLRKLLHGPSWFSVQLFVPVYLHRPCADRHLVLLTLSSSVQQRTWPGVKAQ